LQKLRRLPTNLSMEQARTTSPPDLASLPPLIETRINQNLGRREKQSNQQNNPIAKRLLIDGHHSVTKNRSSRI